MPGPHKATVMLPSLLSQNLVSVVVIQSSGMFCGLCSKRESLPSCFLLHVRLVVLTVKIHILHSVKARGNAEEMTGQAFTSQDGKHDTVMWDKNLLFCSLLLCPLYV